MWRKSIYTNTEYVQFVRALRTMSADQLMTSFQNATTNEGRQLVREEIARRTAQFATI